MGRNPERADRKKTDCRSRTGSIYGGAEGMKMRNINRAEAYKMLEKYITFEYNSSCTDRPCVRIDQRGSELNARLFADKIGKPVK